MRSCAVVPQFFPFTPLCRAEIAPHPAPVLSSAYRPLIYCSLYNKKNTNFPNSRSGPRALSLAADLRWPPASILIADYIRRVPRPIVQSLNDAASCRYRSLCKRIAHVFRLFFPVRRDGEVRFRITRSVFA